MDQAEILGLFLVVASWPIAGIFAGLIHRFFGKRGVILIATGPMHILDYARMGWIICAELIIGAPILLYVQYKDRKKSKEAAND